MKLFNTNDGIILADGDKHFKLDGAWDAVINQRSLFKSLSDAARKGKPLDAAMVTKAIAQPLAPIGKQEVWASGVTYLRSRDARMEESKDSGGSDFYQKVYEADRPELFFKALPQRVVGTGQDVIIRKDSTWNVPEPELTLFINTWGEIQGYTAGNDMSSRSIEGENPLYLPQAKSYEGSCALGPCLYVPEQPIARETTIKINIHRQGKAVFDGSIQLNKMKRTLPELAGWLFKELVFPNGVFLMTGTGLVPGNDFTLAVGDVVSISIENIGTLTNTVAVSKK